MIGKILGRTQDAYSTAKVTDVATSVKRDKVVDRMIKSVVSSKLRSEPHTGHVRMRNRVGNDESVWDTELFSGACHLSKA